MCLVKITKKHQFSEHLKCHEVLLGGKVVPVSRVDEKNGHREPETRGMPYV